MNMLALCWKKFCGIPVFNWHVLILLCALLMPGCSIFISSATSDLAQNLSYAIINNDDLATVKEGGPAYLLLIDSLLSGNPNNESLLQAASTLYTAYTAMFVEDNLRAQRLSDKALRYALHAICVHRSETCSLKDIHFQEFEKVIAEMNKNKDVPILFTLGSAWAGWIQAHQEDWNAIAEIPRVVSIMQHVVKLDEDYQDGSAHLYLGVMASFPDEAREHFERAIKLSGGKNLMMKVLYARQYARAKFDRELHDRLLQEVLKTKPNIPGYTLINTLAQKQARELLDNADDYF
jgi:tetratricopeptide (TPR) repeat protein